jgi:hypothetical protein
MKKVMQVLLISGFLVGSTTMLMADVRTFTVSATVPAPTSVSITAHNVNAATSVWTLVPGTALSFDPLTYDLTNQIYVPNHYFVVNAGPAAGSGATDVTVSYTEGSNPNGAIGGHGLGWKSVATFARVVGTTETLLASHGPKKLLKDLAGEHITPAELGLVGTFRMYLGIELNPLAAGEPAGAEVFSAADRTGSYSGSLTVTATVT